MKFFHRIFFLGVVLLLALCFVAPPVLAQNDACSGETKSVACDPNDPSKGQCIKLCNPLENNRVDITEILGIIIKAALTLVGSLTLLMLVWGAFQWLTSAGNPERVKKGTDTMLWATIGVILVFASYFIVINFTQYLTGTEEDTSPGRPSAPTVQESDEPSPLPGPAERGCCVFMKGGQVQKCVGDLTQSDCQTQGGIDWNKQACGSLNQCKLPDGACVQVKECRGAGTKGECDVDPACRWDNDYQACLDVIQGLNCTNQTDELLCSAPDCTWFSQ